MKISTGILFGVAIVVFIAIYAIKRKEKVKVINSICRKKDTAEEIFKDVLLPSEFEEMFETFLSWSADEISDIRAVLKNLTDEQLLCEMLYRFIYSNREYEKIKAALLMYIKDGPKIPALKGYSSDDIFKMAESEGM